MSAPEPGIAYAAVGPCPTTGNMCCIADAPVIRCADGEDRNGDGKPDLCKASGEYRSCGEGVVRIRDPRQIGEGCGDPTRIEMVHHLLRHRDGDPDREHRSEVFGRCG